MSLVSISDKAYKAVSFDGSSDVLPKSQVFGEDWDVSKSDAYWISAWILKKKNIQHSTKKEAWFDADTGDRLPTYSITHHKPKKLQPVKNNTIKKLKK